MFISSDDFEQAKPTDTRFSTSHIIGQGTRRQFLHDMDADPVVGQDRIAQTQD
jgi:hypothetical protein